MDYDNKGQVALWKNKTDNEKAPNAKGHFFAHRDIKEGEKVDLALWKNVSDNDNAPVMKGKISDEMQKSVGSSDSAKRQPAPAEDFDDDIPF